MTPSPLVGRTVELSLIEAALNAAGSGEFPAILLAGEAGVGKTRLVAEVKARAATSGFTILEGASFEFDRSVPLAPFADLIRTFLLRAPAETARRAIELAGADLAAIVPEVERLNPRAIDLPTQGPDQVKRRAFAGICELVRLQAESGPVVVVIEDMHWGDDLSLELFLVLARRLRTRPVVLLGTYRSDEVDPSLASAIAQLTHARLGEVIELKPFGAKETGEFVQQLIGAGALREDVVQSLHSLTEGNPFFLEEVGKSMGAAGQGLRADAGVTRLPLGVIRPPESIREAVRRRTRELSPNAARVLSVAAVTGRRFEFDLLSTVTGIAEAELVPLVRELFDAHLLVEEFPDRFSFRHALTQQAVLAGMLTRERRQQHLHVAEAIRRQGRNSDISDLANHFFQAEAWAEAAEYSGMAGERAMAMFSPKAAAEQFDRAVLALEAAGMEPGWELLWSRARAHDTVGDFEPARAGYEAAVAAARRRGDRRKECQGLVHLGLLWSSKDYQSARDYLEESLQLARSLNDPSLLAQSLNRFGNFQVNALRPEEGIVFHREALAIAEVLGDEAQVAECYDLLGMASYQAGNMVTGDGYFEQAIGRFRKSDNRYGLASALAVRALCGVVIVGDTEVPCDRAPAEQLRDIEEALSVARASGWKAGEAFACAVIAWVLSARGDYARALDAGRQSLAIAEEIDHRQWMVAASCALGRLSADVLANDTALGHLEGGYGLARELQSPLWICNIGGSLIALLARLGKFERAAAVLEEANVHISGQRSVQARSVAVGAAILALESGQPATALAAIDELQGDASQRLPVPLLYHLRGEALVGLNRLEEADAAFGSAVELAQARGMRPQLWRSQLALGGVARLQGQRARASTAFVAARATAMELRDELRSTDLLEPFQAGIDHLLPPLREPTPAQAAKQAFSGLTSRERDIASLIAEGLTNRSIAEALTLGERTVEAHVSNILAKLGLTSRAQIAAWATERGLRK